ncbi:MAG: hybrid sensor histidine kinase/response regulator [Rhodospirillales bacterium]|jgi:DNA-binding NtrC family response regulator|nr:hybrid sensor histidine kinase/response regulator [Rhodospirillales bacterium]
MGQPAILFVDDCEDVLELAALALNEAGFDVMTAVSGDVALILLEQRVPFRLLITDIVMPGFLDGFALARKAREYLPDIRVIYTTGYREIANVRSRGAPFGEILAKPWSPRALVELVGASLTGKQATEEAAQTATLLRRPA